MKLLVCPVSQVFFSPDVPDIPCNDTGDLLFPAVFCMISCELVQIVRYRVYNADAVGAYNILRKYHYVSGVKKELSVTGLKTPEIIKVAVLLYRAYSSGVMDAP